MSILSNIINESKSKNISTPTDVSLYDKGIQNETPSPNINVSTMPQQSIPSPEPVDGKFGFVDEYTFGIPEEITQDDAPVTPAYSMTESLIQSAERENKLYEIRNNEFSYHVKQDRGVSILIFRGTDNAKNIGTDIDVRPAHDKSLDVYFHKGFKDAATWIFEDINDKYELEKTVYLTGHSLGGAIAQIIGLWLNNAGYNVQIYTFGSPKVSTTFFGNRPIHYRVLVRNDPVPFVPPYPFLHSGISIDAETLNWEEGGEVNRGSFGEIDGRDHSIKEYLKILKGHEND